MPPIARRFAILRFVSAFLRTRMLARRLKTRADIEAWQNPRIARWLRDTVAPMDFYRGRDVSRLDRLPVTDKSIVMEAFERFNSQGVTRDAGFAMLETGTAPAGHSVGASTGTSGNRGLFVVSDGERFEWLGVMVAKLLKRFPLASARVALILPRDTALYAAANHARRLDLRFFDLREGVAALAPQIIAYRPDTLIAPPKVLRWLADNDASLSPLRVFSGAEVLDPLDRSVIEARYGVTVREIYMATEGLLGVACEEGTMHLAEDVVHFEFERSIANSDLVSPIVSDFTRCTQVTARYRMNDLLRLSDEPCRCGSPLQAVSEIVGRADDVFVLPARSGGSTVMVTPDILRNAIVNADPEIKDFRVIQSDSNIVYLILPRTLGLPSIMAACEALGAAIWRLGAAPEYEVEPGDMEAPTEKLRRVERRWWPSRDA